MLAKKLHVSHQFLPKNLIVQHTLVKYMSYVNTRRAHACVYLISSRETFTF